MVKYTVRLPTGNEYGPADLATLRTWRDEGRIGTDSWVWTEGAPDWVPLSEVLGAGPGGATSAPAASPGASTTRAPASPTPRAAAAEPTRPVAAAKKTPAAAAAPRASGRAGSAAAGHGTDTQPPAASAGPAAAQARKVPARPRPRPTGAGTTPRARSRGGTGGLLMAGGALVLLLILGVAARMVLLPWIQSWRAAGALRGEALAEGRFDDPEAGLLLEARGDWLLLKPESSLLVAPLAQARLAHATLGARAILVVRRQPPGRAPLDAILDQVVAERQPLVSGYSEAGRSDAELAGRPARRLNAAWSEAGVEQRATALATRDAWVYVSLLAWGPAAAGADLEAAFDELAAGLDVAGALERRLDARVTELLAEFPELSRPSVEALVRLAGEAEPGPGELAATVVTAVDRGLRSLSPSEARAFREIYARVFEPLSDADRQRLAAWQQMVRQGQNPGPAEGQAARAAVRASLDRLPGEMLVELQLLHEKAILSDLGG